MKPITTQISERQTSKSLRSRKLVDLQFKDITYSVDTLAGSKKSKAQINVAQKTILSNLTGYCPGGEVTAIMGSSGAGKTTLLNLLAGRVQQSKGELLANSQPYSFETFSDFASYVMQNDVLLESLTPREAFTFAANLKYSDPDLKLARVRDTIRSMKLERCCDTYIGGVSKKGISGGEKKRTSIGFELVGNPSCLLLDEPTSGLDSFTAFQIIHQLKLLAEEQDRTIIFTIHQPSSDIFKLFDRIMLLVGGQFIYQGPRENIIDYFSGFGFKCPIHSNPMDYFLSIMHHDEANIPNYPIFFENYQSKINPLIIEKLNTSVVGEIERKIVFSSFFFQISVIAQRAFTNFMREPMYAKARIFQAIFQGLVLGGVFWGVADNNGSISHMFSTAGALFFICINITFPSVIQVVLGFALEREVYLREENSKLYTTTTYFLGTQMVEVPFCIICPIIQQLIAYWMCSFNSSEANIPVTHVFISICLTLCCNSLGLMAGCFFKNVSLALNVIPTILTPLMIFSGFIANSNGFYVWIGWFQYLSPMKYAFEAFSYNEFENRHYEIDPIQQYNFDIGLWQSVAVLIGFIFVYRALALVFLNGLKSRLQ